MEDNKHPVTGTAHCRRRHDEPGLVAEPVEP